MITDRHSLVGIKQIIRLEWLRKTANLLLAGLESPLIRKELHEYLQNDKLYNSLARARSAQSRKFAVANLMRIWVEPELELIPFRNECLEYLRQNPHMEFAAHWAMLCAAYPFWFNIARQAGRLLALQSRITSDQVTHRLKELYGDRATIIRNAGYVLSAFLAWGALKDTAAKGRYERAPARLIGDPRLAMLLFEAALLAMPEGKGTFNQLLHCPAFFPFAFPALNGDRMARENTRLEMTRYISGEEIFGLRAVRPHGK